MKSDFRRGCGKVIETVFSHTFFVETDLFAFLVAVMNVAVTQVMNSRTVVLWVALPGTIVGVKAVVPIEVSLDFVPRAIVFKSWS